jgi:hypothetical protein
MRGLQPTTTATTDLRRKRGLRVSARSSVCSRDRHWCHGGGSIAGAAEWSPSFLILAHILLVFPLGLFSIASFFHHLSKIYSSADRKLSHCSNGRKSCASQNKQRGHVPPLRLSINLILKVAHYHVYWAAMWNNTTDFLPPFFLRRFFTILI